MVSRSQNYKGFGPTLDRYQVIQLSGESSDPVCLIYRVPHGSLLGLLEFIAYICPIYDIAQRHGISVHQYDDDTYQLLYLAFDLDMQQEALAKMEVV